MSGQGAATPAPAPKVRRNVDLSPSQTQRQGPIKAVKPFILKGPPSRSPSSPSNSGWPRRSPGIDRNSPDRSSPFKVERPKPIRGSPASSSSSLRRTGSLDTIGPYLNGQWPTATVTSSPSQPMIDKTTQTPDDWQSEVIEEKTKKKKKHRRSASFGHADKKSFSTPADHTLGLNRIRQKLQKTKDQGTKQRSSPIPANHNALLQTAPAVLMRSPAINIPISKGTISKSSVSVPRYQRSSVEGLNMEIEKLVLKTVSTPDEETDRAIDIPDGHRAPLPEMRTSSTRSIDTQTPSGIRDGGRSSESPASRPQSISPGCGMRYISGQMENSPRPSSCNDSSGSTPRDKSDNNTGDSDSVSPENCLKKTSSPKPNQIVREPPDGCEKVKVFDEDKVPTIKPHLIYPPQGQGHFILKPSSSSAFFPIKRLCTPQGSNLNHTSPHPSTIIDS